MTHGVAACRNVLIIKYNRIKIDEYESDIGTLTYDTFKHFVEGKMKKILKYIFQVID